MVHIYKCTYKPSRCLASGGYYGIACCETVILSSTCDEGMVKNLIKCTWQLYLGALVILAIISTGNHMDLSAICE